MITTVIECLRMVIGKSIVYKLPIDRGFIYISYNSALKQVELIKKP